MLMLSLSMNTILRECNNMPLDMSCYEKIRSESHERLHDLFKICKYQEDFIDYCMVYNPDSQYLIGYLKPSYPEFLIKLCNYLNLSIGDKLEDDASLTKKLLERVNKLNQISSIPNSKKCEEELAKEFPLVLRDIHLGQGAFLDIDSRYGTPRKDSKNFKKKVLEEQELYRCGLFRDIERSATMQATMYRRMVEGREKYKERISGVSLNRLLRDYINQDKLAMYFMHEYLSLAESTNDLRTVKECVNQVRKYLDSDKDKSVSLKTDDDKKIDINCIKERLERLEFLLRGKQEVVEWVLIPKGKDDSKVVSGGGSRTIKMSQDELKRIIEIGTKKNNFYEQTPYMAKVVGLHRYKGYIGYIYPNGKVILDRCFDSRRPSSLKGDAIYVIDAVNFLALSGLDKTTLRKDSRVGIMIHNDTWQERVSKVINEKTSEEKQKEASALVKKLKDIKNN